MANDVDLRILPLEMGNGGHVQGHYYQITTANDVYVGQPVYLGSDGILEITPTGTAGYSPCLGICLGFTVGDSSGINRGSDMQTPSTSGNPWLDVSALPGSGKTAYALVADDPQQQYVVALDTAGGSTYAQTEFGSVSALIHNATSNNTTTGFTNIMVDRSLSVATTGAGPAVIVLRPHDNMNSDGTRNDINSAYAKVVVQIAAHQLGGVIGGGVAEVGLD